MKTSAVFSPCRTWRYTLTREWDADAPRMMMVGLNPSTADEFSDDPTVRRCIGFAKREGCGTLVMTNIFALRSTDPRELYRGHAIVGIDNDRWLARTAAESDLIVCAWGNHGKLSGRGEQVVELLSFWTLQCFGTTRERQPKHPLYLRADSPLIHFAGPQWSDDELVAAA